MRSARVVGVVEEGREWRSGPRGRTICIRGSTRDNILGDVGRMDVGLGRAKVEMEPGALSSVRTRVKLCRLVEPRRRKLSDYWQRKIIGTWLPSRGWERQKREGCD